MNGRKAQSTKWTPFPPEYSDQIQSVFKEAFATQLGDSKLIVEGKIYPTEICLRVGFKEPGGLRQNNFEISVDFQPNEQNAIETIYSCIDGVASLMNSFFEGASVNNLPLEWKQFNFEGKTMFFQYSTVNSDLEAEADKLLGAFDDHLMRDSGDEDEEGKPNLH